MNRSHRLAAVCGILLLVSVCGFLSSTANGRDTAPKVLLMLDSSGSMEDGDPSGGTKMDAAKNALAHAFDAASPNVEVGLRVYGADVDVNSTSGYCADSRLAHPVGVLDKAVLASAVNQFQPRGGSTPIVYALKEGAKDLGDRGERRIILVSDGGETCSPDPCREVRDLVAGGTSPQIDIVGFGVGDTVRQQLSCIAEAGGGAYYDAKDADSLETSLQQLGAEATHELAAADTAAKHIRRRRRRGEARAGGATPVGPGRIRPPLRSTSSPWRCSGSAVPWSCWVAVPWPPCCCGSVAEPRGGGRAWGRDGRRPGCPGSIPSGAS
ncbi:VWA domain-containing protein [[Pseudopropionibacterium] massiliense]|uniref:VWA domain-containing protein n=1 Tax=[Pseudopropionibacterium] massiliense TaxID=2220000 RepID=UPI00103241F1|nr:VWA domain-containing protein [[Pseudopropionibacterium] massiliense]